MATFTTSIIHESVFGNKRIVTADITAVGSATATGDAYAPSTLGLRGLDIMLCGNPVTLSATGTATTAADLGYGVTYDYVNEKFVYTRDAGSAGPSTATTAQVTNTKFRIMAVGY